MTGTISSGYASLDEALGGWHPGQLVLVAARPAMGKSAFLLGSALSAVERNKEKAALFSLEMSFEAICERTRLQGALTPPLPMHGPDTRAALHLDPAANLSVAELRQRCLALAGGSNPRIILVDYLQLLRSSLGPHENTRELKRLAREFNATVIVATQLHRSETDSDSEAPSLSTLRAHCSVESDADLILFLHRGQGEEYGSLVIGKNRAGPIGTIQLRWNRRRVAFENVGADF